MVHSPCKFGQDFFNTAPVWAYGRNQLSLRESHYDNVYDKVYCKIFWPSNTPITFCTKRSLPCSLRWQTSRK